MERIVAIGIDGTQIVEITRLDLLERFAELIAAEEREQCDALRVEMERYRTAITLCINYANGRESEWGQRAMDAFGILEAALAAGEVSDENRI